MKNLFALLLTLTFVGPLSEAKPKLNTTFADLIYFDLDKNSGLNDYHFENGFVKISNDEIIVHIAQKPIDCPPGAFCVQMMPITQEFKAKLINKTTSCGSLIYQAVADLTRVDGDRIEITVADHSSRVCEDVVPFITEIKVKETFYDRIHGQEVNYLHKFGANGLKSNR